jgi:hypothetical protein
MCKVEVMELSGASIGEIQFELETLEPTSSLELTVPVGGVPKTVEGFCAEAARPQGSYEFDELSLHQAVDDWTGEQSLELIARALWSGDASPGTAFCRATAELRDGAQIHEDFTLAVPNGTKVTVHVPAAFRDALDISIACGATAKEGWR